MNKHLFLQLIFTMAWFVCEGAQAKLFDAKRFSLENGLEVIVVENHRAPIIKQMLVYKSGSVDEAVGKGGSAHLLEHLMFRGTKKVEGQKFNQIMADNGAESNAFTSQNVTAYHQLLDVSRLELAMYLEADRMKNLRIKDKDFLAERDIVFQERKQRVDNNPLAQFSEELRRVLWQNNPYAEPVGGLEQEIEELSKADVEGFYRRYYAPENAILVLSGDIDVVLAKKLAQKYYGGLSGNEKIVPTFLPKLKNVKNRLEMKLEGVQTPRLWKIMATASYQYNSQKVYPLQILAAYMGEGESSKLYKKLVRDSKKALSVSVDYNPMSRSYGEFVIAAVPAPEVSIEELEKALNEAWDKALAELNTDEAQKAKSKILSNLIYLKDNPSDAAYILGVMRSIGVPLEEIENIADKIKAVDFQQMRSVAEDLAVNSPQITGILLPEGKNNAK